MNDMNGLSLSTRSAGAAECYNRALSAYLSNRADFSANLGALLEADPEFALGHCFRGYGAMLMFNRAMLPLAAGAHRAAENLVPGATRREQAHVRALGRWAAGNVDGALQEWEVLLAEWPHDALAIRLAHFNYFWTGRAADMRASLERVAARWSDALPTYATLLSCLAFALEETGDYDAAERAGRRAVEIDPSEVWGTHAVAHVLEMQGRREEGIAWLAGLERHWEGKNNFVHHLWWHRAMFHLELRETDAVLELYDKRFRNLASPLVQAMPDLYIDVQNAASMLFRLERQAVHVGARWHELAEKAQARIGDCQSAFTLPHWMMALAAAGRDSAAQLMLSSLRENANRVVREVASPVCEAVLAHRRGDHARAVLCMAPVLERLHELGGSHAQRDVLHQLYFDACLKSRRVGYAAGVI